MSAELYRVREMVQHRRSPDCLDVDRPTPFAQKDCGNIQLVALACGNVFHVLGILAIRKIIDVKV